MDLKPGDPPAEMNIDRTKLDIMYVEKDEAPIRLLKTVLGAREPHYQVVVQRSVLEAIHEHGKSDTTVEVCGVLVGDIHHDRISPYLLITGWIAGDKATSKQTQVTFTAETWNLIQKKMESDYPTSKIVGWYHTHPGFGVFLSGMDLFIQDNFFNLAWQVAHVYDPINEDDGMFVWKLGKSERSDFLIEENMGEWGYDFRKKFRKDDNVPSSGQQRFGTRWTDQLTIYILIFATCFALMYFMADWLKLQGLPLNLREMLHR